MLNLIFLTENQIHLDYIHVYPYRPESEAHLTKSYLIFKTTEKFSDVCSFRQTSKFHHGRKYTVKFHLGRKAGYMNKLDSKPTCHIASDNRV